MASTTYFESFGDFLRATDEKTVFADFVVDQLANVRGGTVLDIGPGDGRLSSLILEQVPMTYTAVEVNPHLASVVASSLEGTVITDSYPTSQLGDAVFDAVLSLYSLPIEVDKTKTFAREMINQTISGGKLIVITYGSHQDEWQLLRSKLSEAIDLEQLRGFDESNAQSDERNNLCLELLEGAGETLVGVLESTLAAETIEEFFSAVSFLLSAGEEELLDRVNAAREALLPILETCKQGDEYRVTMQHSYFVTNKAQS